ncbi:vesicle transport protein GOT1A isoform X1 [Balaenoptera acutorostrata]|uniref:Vesicle transport protein GOT1A isoform X1 n=3 Tax=Balaenoptera acutorostrata TaxID=9767 RepID=A0ABM3UBW1_BALAC|nr:vesicle transport protein GOT1A isoform X1 [Balaenoptera acutorostrata]
MAESQDSWMAVEPPHPPPPRGHLSSGNGGKFQHPKLLPKAHPTTTSLPIAEIGVGTTGFGIFFILFGMFLYFDSVLLAFGNLLFLTGLSLIIGLRKTFSFFFQRHKLKGTSFFLGGVVIVLLRWPLLGMLLETYGFFNLFKGFFSVAFGFLGNTSNIPFLSVLFQRLQGTSSMV